MLFWGGCRRFGSLSDDWPACLALLEKIGNLTNSIGTSCPQSLQIWAVCKERADIADRLRADAVREHQNGTEGKEYAAKRRS